MIHTASIGWWRPAAPGGAAPAAETSPESSPASPGSSVPFWGLMCFTVVLLTAPQSIIPALAPFRPALLAAGISIVACLADGLFGARPLIPVTTPVLLVGCLAGWAIATLPFSYWPTGSAAFLLDVYLKTLAVFWLLGIVVTTRARLRATAVCLVLLAIPLSVTAVRNLKSGLFLPGGMHENLRRIAGYNAPLTDNPNDLALMLNLILPLAIALFVLHRGPLVRIALAGVILLLAGAVIATFSRAGFLTLATILILHFGKLLRRSERGWVPLLLLILLCLPLVPAGYFQQMGTITDIGADPTGSAPQRLDDMVAALEYFIENPVIGAGAGMNILAMNEQRGPAWRLVHNVYLEYAVELGLPGLALFLLLFISCLRATLRVQRECARSVRSRDLFHLGAALHISLCAFAIAALFHPVGYHFYFYYLAGLTVGLTAAHDADTARSPALAGERRCVWA